MQSFLRLCVREVGCVRSGASPLTWAAGQNEGVVWIDGGFCGGGDRVPLQEIGVPVNQHYLHTDFGLRQTLLVQTTRDRKGTATEGRGARAHRDNNGG